LEGLQPVFLAGFTGRMDILLNRPKAAAGVFIWSADTSAVNG
jgi:hypothetical protein